MGLITTICITVIIAFYLTVCQMYVKHMYFINLLLKINPGYLIGWRIKYVVLNPMYRVEYFGYNYFLLSEENNFILHPTNKMRVYGIVRPYSKCLILYRKDRVKTIINLKEVRYADDLSEEFRKRFRKGIYILIGGVLIWQVYLKYMT